MAHQSISNSPVTGTVRMDTSTGDFLVFDGAGVTWKTVPAQTSVEETLKELVYKTQLLETIVLQHPQLKELYEQELIVRKLKGDSDGKNDG